MNREWCIPVAYDLTRTPRRTSVPRALEERVPEKPGTYVIYCLGQLKTSEKILDIGECGPRQNSTPPGLRGRLASTCDHSASEKIAQDVKNGKLSGDLCVVWYATESKEVAKDIQDALISLFRRECGRRPRYNRNGRNHPQPDSFQSIYADVKARIGCSAAEHGG